MVLFYRIKQFWHAIFSKITPYDMTFLKSYLRSDEILLFNYMDRPTQTHCIRVARTCLKQLPKYKQVDKNLLIRAALLHDIGKPANVIKIFDKVLIVLFSTLAPNLYREILINDKKPKYFHKTFSTHVHHPQNGAKIAERANMSPDLVYLIKNHHQPEQTEDPLELKILRQADELN